MAAHFLKGNLPIKTLINIFSRNQPGEGDSGTVLYKLDEDQKHPFAMAIGKIYDRNQAILLEPALRDIEIDYKHHVADLKPFR